MSKLGLFLKSSPLQTPPRGSAEAKSWHCYGKPTPRTPRTTRSIQGFSTPFNLYYAKPGSRNPMLPLLKAKRNSSVS